MPNGDSLQRDWYRQGVEPPWWARLLARLYGHATAWRRGMYQRGWLRVTRLPVPAVVVGNISVGGTGKTPLVIALVEALRVRGFSPGVVSRGYGGDTRTPVLLDANSDPARVGDEPCLIRLRTGVPVAVGANRPAAARLLLDHEVDVVVADDGLQHYALARDVETCVIDGVRRLGNERLLPAGPLREPVARLRDVDFIVCNGGAPHAGEVPMRLGLQHAQTLAGQPRTQPLTAFAGQRVHAVAGIGNPGRFFAALREAGIEVIEHPFPDHYRYAEADFGSADGVPVLMTEKDAVKCRGFAKPGWWAVPVTASLPDSFFEAIVTRITRAA